MKYNDIWNEFPIRKKGNYIDDKGPICGPYWNDINRPMLISFPRTGSHWLVMVCELYFKKGVLSYPFYYHDGNGPDDYLMYHYHDTYCDLKDRQNIIYLYRKNFIDTVFSYMVFCNKLWNNKNVIENTKLYANHINYWLYNQDIDCLTIVTYEGLIKDFNEEFNKICDHFNSRYVNGRLQECLNRVTKEEIKTRDQKNKSIIKTGDKYENMRKNFKDKYSNMIESEFYSIIDSNRFNKE